MNIFMKNKWPSYLPKVNAVWQKINTDKLNRELNSDVHMSGSEKGLTVLFMIIVICTFLFWI